MFINFNWNIKFLRKWLLNMNINKICISIANGMCEVEEIEFIEGWLTKNKTEKYCIEFPYLIENNSKKHIEKINNSDIIEKLEEGSILLRDITVNKIVEYDQQVVQELIKLEFNKILINLMQEDMKQQMKYDRSKF